MSDISNIQSSAAVLIRALENFHGIFTDGVTGESLSAQRLRQVHQAALPRFYRYAGQAILLPIGNSLAFPIAFFAAISAGANPLVVPDQFALAELDMIARRIGAAAVVTTNKCADERYGTYKRRRIETDPDFDLCEIDLAGQPRDFKRLSPPMEGVPLHPTSGTSSQSKIAVRPGFSAVEEARHYIEKLKISAGKKILCPVPMAHAYGFGMGMMVSLIGSHDLIFMDRFRPRLLARLAQKSDIGVMMLTPAMLPVLERFCGELSHIEHILTAGSPLSAAAANSFHQACGKRPSSLFGTTETGGISINLSGDEDFGVGSPMDGVEATVSDTTQISALKIKSSSMMSGYLTDDGIDSSPITSGWMTTGDLARIDNGNLHLHGRSDDLINVMGKKVLATQVQEVIEAIAAVTAVKVYRGYDQRGEEAVFAAVVSTGISEIAIRQHCLKYLSPEKCPRNIFFLEQLPTTPSGKVVTRLLPQLTTS